MGDISPSKMPAAKTKRRRDNTDFTVYKRGGMVAVPTAQLGKPSVQGAVERAAGKRRK